MEQFDAFEEVERRKEIRREAQRFYRALRRINFPKDQAAYETYRRHQIAPVTAIESKAVLTLMLRAYRRMRETWYREAHTWYCGQQDGYGETTDALKESMRQELEVAMLLTDEAAMDTISKDRWGA